MTQVEIAKKILEQGNCSGISCKNNCPFYDTENSDWNTNCMIWIKNKNNIFDRDMDKVKQWLKEKEMIDLTVNQIVEPPVKCWLRCFNEEWSEDYLYSIDHRLNFPFRGHVNEYKQCSLTDPTKKFKPWLKVEDVPVNLWGKALFKKQEEESWRASLLEPNMITTTKGNLYENLVYIPLGQPLNSEWLEMGEWE